MNKTYRHFVINTNILFAIIPMICFLMNCFSPIEDKGPTFNALSYFPYQQIGNWWKYSEKGGNSLSITVEDTISDNGTLYYKIAFIEKGKGNYNDWFKYAASKGVVYSSSLSGSYIQFVPPTLYIDGGSFETDSGTITYSKETSVVLNSKTFSNSLLLSYSRAYWHGFSEIYVCDSVGMVGLIDGSGRFPVEYILDSAQIDGSLLKF